jgi:hypothetical protein
MAEPRGYIIRVYDRGGKVQIEMDEMDAILSLGNIGRLEYDDTTKNIRIELVHYLLV